MPAEKTYQGIYPKQWSKIKETVGRYGFQIETDEGQKEAYGVTLKWKRNYRVSSSQQPTLKIEIVNAGILQPAEALNFVDQIIQDAIA